jgi:hypothetical protein
MPGKKRGIDRQAVLAYRRKILEAFDQVAAVPLPVREAWCKELQESETREDSEANVGRAGLVALLSFVALFEPRLRGLQAEPPRPKLQLLIGGRPGC